MRRGTLIGYLYTQISYKGGVAFQQKIWQKNAEKKKAVVPSTMKSGVYFTLISVNASVCVNVYACKSMSEQYKELTICKEWMGLSWNYIYLVFNYFLSKNSLSVL